MTSTVAKIEVPFIKNMMKTTYDMWNRGWDELNGGNISILLSEEEIKEYFNPNEVQRTIELPTSVPELAGKYFLVTGSGKYFRLIIENPEESLGLLRVGDNGNFVEVLWGLKDGGNPTSELPSHFLSHIERLKQDPSHKVVMHCHATNVVAMTFSHELNEVDFTRTLWKMCTECLVVFPEGVGLMPWMVPGTEEIGRETAKKMKEFRLVIWPHHGIFAAGKSLEEAFGLIETVEKAATIYMLISSHKDGIKQMITDAELKDLAKAFNVSPPDKYFP